MKILAIETSCDETGICLIEANENRVKILGNQLYSQVALHAKYGGVYPNMAKREHAENLVPLLEKCLEESGELRETVADISEERKLKAKEFLVREIGLYEKLISLVEKIEKPNIDAIAVTNGPGLEPALWVGIMFAKALSALWDIPLYPQNHMEGHVVVAPLVKISDTEFEIKKHALPAIALLISGGHTQLVLIDENNKYKIIGNTKDDAVGEAYDKVARILGLPYPGGPQISRLAEKEKLENPNKKPPYPLPRPMINSKDLFFSFSGLKTAVLYTVKKIPDVTEQVKQEIASEFENAVLDVLTTKTKMAIEKTGAKALIIGGGVIANKRIRSDFENMCREMNIEYLIPEIKSSTDNAFMIAISGLLNIISGQKTNVDFRADGNLKL